MIERNITHTPFVKFGANFLRLAWLMILFLLLPVVFVLSGMIDLKRDMLLIIPLVIVPIGISIYRAVLIAMNLDLEILLFNDGFRYSKNGETRKYSWKEIDKVWTVRYEIVSIIYIKYIKVKILDTSGKMLILDRTLKNVDKFEAIVQEQIAKDKFPQMVNMLQRGMKLEFGKLTLTKDYIENEHDTILWNEFGDLQVWQGSLRLWRKGERAISIIASVPSTPNFALLLFLIRYLSDNPQTSSLPLQEPGSIGKISNEQRIPVKSKTGIRIKPGGNFEARLTGLFLFTISAGALYWELILPIRQALMQEVYISYSVEVAILASLALLMGLFLLVFGAEGLGSLAKWKPSSKLGLIALLVGILIYIAGCYLGTELIFRWLGYY